MRKSTLFLIVALGLTAVVRWAEPLTSAEKTAEKIEQAAPMPMPPAASNAEASRTVPLDPALEEIMRIREATGSPIRGSLFENLQTDGKGTNSGKSAIDLFAETLKRLAAEAPATTIKTESVPPSTDDPPPALFPPDNTEAPNDMEFVLLMRAACRSLDSKANDLEEQRMYEDANRLRKLSRQLRSEARRYDLE